MTIRLARSDDFAAIQAIEIEAAPCSRQAARGLDRWPRVAKIRRVERQQAP